MATNMAEEKHWFQHFFREEIRNKRVNTTPKNTVKANQKAAWAIQEFLNESEEYEGTNFEKFSPDKLNEVDCSCELSCECLFPGPAE